MGKLVLECVSDLFAVDADLEGPIADIEDPSPVFVWVFAVGADGVGFSAAHLLVVVGAFRVGIEEGPTILMVDSWVSCEQVDANLEQANTYSSCSGTVSVTSIGGEVKQ